MKSVQTLVSELTIEEKAALLEGLDSWYTNPIPRLGIPQLLMTDGPHGVRMVRQVSGGFGISDNEHSTAFPTSVTVASTWNEELAYRMGEAIALECKAAGVDVLLAPGVNMKRSSLCGRNFEYYSEDPLLSGRFGTAFVSGVQSKGIGCTVKHFAANSNEDYRFYGDSIVDERALREIYLRAFESVVKEAKPYAVMCAYNQINGTYSSNNKWLLHDVLREEWGFDGIVMTDWGATHDRIADIQAGCELDMPGGVKYNCISIIEAVRQGKLSIEQLDTAVTRVLTLIQKCRSSAPPKHDHDSHSQQFDSQEHAHLSCEIAKEGAVLLKNNGILPLRTDQQLLVVGPFFEKLRFQGAGSSLINPPEVITARQAFDHRRIPYHYEQGFLASSPERDQSLEQSALQAAEHADTIVFFGGLTDFEESEGFDRKHMKLGENQVDLLEKLAATGKNIIVILHTGSPVEIPVLDRLAAVLTMYLPGMYGGEATAALLFGEQSPSGKLAESWLRSIEDSSCYADYGRSHQSRYYESIYVGYRYYEKAGTEVQFPFGYGLSYTSFQYDHLTVKQEEGKITVQLDITNTGGFDGAEVVQVYVQNNPSNVFKAVKELRAFKKIMLRAGETQSVELMFSRSDLSFWHSGLSRWVLENGRYEICVGASSVDIRQTAELLIVDGESPAAPYTEAISNAYANPPKHVPDCFHEFVGYSPQPAVNITELTLDSPLSDFKKTWSGKLLYHSIMWFIKRDYNKAKAMEDSLERDTRLKNAYFVYRMMPSNTLRAMCMASSGAFPYSMALGFVEIGNGRLFRGIKHLMKREQAPPLPHQQ